MGYRSLLSRDLARLNHDPVYYEKGISRKILCLSVAAQDFHSFTSRDPFFDLFLSSLGFNHRHERREMERKRVRIIEQSRRSH